ncbi:MAG: Na+/H+ antiporter subunit E [Mesorhizobium sp.]|nr:Na+/H+ antiporter subunit E [Mesorhizobium sp.]MBL8578335.1 Na+/H+ antiporter subunit E [Mesorhizobium sp.]
MTRFLPYPILTACLALMWLLLAGFTSGQLVLAVLVAIGAARALKALGEASPPVKRWLLIVEFIGIVLYDIVRSNLAVASILLSGEGRPRKSGFITMPIKLRNPTGLATLAVVLTSTPGTAWLDYNSTRGELLIHVFDLVDEEVWIDQIVNRYEKPLLEIFE